MTIELAKRLYEALATGDRATLTEVLHPDFEGHTAAGLPLSLGGVYRGPDAMRKEFWGVVARHYQARATPESFEPLGTESLLVIGRYIGVAKASGRELNAGFTHRIDVADGQIRRLDQLTDTQAWHDALDGELETIDYSVRDAVATICLNRPAERNAINQQLADDLLTVARRCAEDRDIRAVLITGNGPALTVGGDIDYFTQTPTAEYGTLFRQMTGPFHEAFRILSRLRVPIVTAAHGSVAGGGLGFVYIADFVLAAPNTKFATAFAAIGLSGDGGGTWFLPRLVGPRRAARMYLRNEVLDADTAAEWGLITEVVPAEQLQENARQLAIELAAGPTEAFGHMRALLRTAWDNTLSEQLLEETESLALTGSTDDAANAIASFVEKQRPTFRGRQWT
ncbi:enoyl-CoA hydratase-related protein [Smaragdicoccus niigatensis]|uniref:enoyl-CoA hydratase-related protein n=1 Tax=Smaragdicoccus niigatensis TaxID=359359 RepID=UPI00035C4F29|nr:enoyl-CoA hydratase-related protein [Smaragdicoccus niigatensis]